MYILIIQVFLKYKKIILISSFTYAPDHIGAGPF